MGFQTVIILFFRRGESCIRLNQGEYKIRPCKYRQRVILQKTNTTINIPNIISIIRILLVPVFIIFITKNRLSSALIVFTIAGISDGLDGFFARYFNQQTYLGAYLDPIADKILLTSAFVALAVIKILPGWLAVIVLSRDILILLGIATLTVFEIKIKIEPTIISKFTTLVQLITIFFILLDPDFVKADLLCIFLYWLTAILTITSGFHYIMIGNKILQNVAGNNHLDK